MSICMYMNTNIIHIDILVILINTVHYILEDDRSPSEVCIHWCREGHRLYIFGGTSFVLTVAAMALYQIDNLDAAFNTYFLRVATSMVLERRRCVVVVTNGNARAEFIPLIGARKATRSCPRVSNSHDLVST